MQTQNTGSQGEKEAEQFLVSFGYRILDHNFRSRFGEIDLIALYNNTLVFIEVKTRSSSLFGSPSEAISYHKLTKLIKTSQYYQMLHKNLPTDIRFDAIEVFFSSNKTVTINHIKNITL